MEFSESRSPWRRIPGWASCLIELGYAWPNQPRDSRMIAVVSMPSDSAAAGLVALGVMRRCLEDNEASDRILHWPKLLALARTQPGGVTLRCNNRNGAFVFDGIYQQDMLWVKKMNSKSKDRHVITSRSAIEWRIDGEAPVVLGNLQEVPNKQFYTDLVKRGNDIIPSNLSESHSRVCLASRGAGEAPTRASLADIHFRKDGVEADLSQLLTVQSWMPGTISRMLFYNSRTEQFDRQVGKPQVVIADGDTSFLKVVDGADFQDSHVIGVVHRTMERDRLESIGTKIESLRQWYSHARINELPQLPRGIGIFVMKRKQV